MKPPFCPVSEYTTWSESSASSKATSNKWRHLAQSRTCSAAATCAFSTIGVHSFISASDMTQTSFFGCQSRDTPAASARECSVSLTAIALFIVKTIRTACADQPRVVRLAEVDHARIRIWQRVVAAAGVIDCADLFAFLGRVGHARHRSLFVSVIIARTAG